MAGDEAERTGDEVERTSDGRYIVVDGRRWRASDPSIPEPLRAELVRALMAGRRAVRHDGDTARPLVHDAKIALGERGDPWWEPTEAGTRERLAAVIRTVLRARGTGTMCPSEAARTVGGADWRALMPTARDVAGELAADGVVVVTQRGNEVDLETVTGPIRLPPRSGAHDAGLSAAAALSPPG